MFYYDIEDWEFKVANGRDRVRESSPIMTIKARFFFSKAVNSMQFTTFTHLSKVPRMNTVVIKSHSTDEMKTVRRKRQDRGWGSKEKEIDLEATFPLCAPLTIQITFHFHSRSVQQLSFTGERFSHADFDCFIAPRPRTESQPSGNTTEQYHAPMKSSVIIHLFHYWSKENNESEIIVFAV